VTDIASAALAMDVPVSVAIFRVAVFDTAFLQLPLWRFR